MLDNNRPNTTRTIRTLQESANHPQNPNDAYENQTTQPNAEQEQTQYDNPAYEHEQTNESYSKSRHPELPLPLSPTSTQSEALSKNPSTVSRAPRRFRNNAITRESRPRAREHSFIFDSHSHCRVFSERCENHERHRAQTHLRVDDELPQK